jgi:post-segregation antitoxin (ccd killing protein)
VIHRKRDSPLNVSRLDCEGKKGQADHRGEIAEREQEENTTASSSGFSHLRLRGASFRLHLIFGPGEPPNALFF